jgi:hypothetical protein
VGGPEALVARVRAEPRPAAAAAEVQARGPDGLQVVARSARALQLRDRWAPVSRVTRLLGRNAQPK